MRKLLSQRGLEGSIEVDSAGTGDWHVGQSPDGRAVRAAAGRGIAMTGRARQVATADFDEFDVIVAMDRSNLRVLRALAPAGSPAEIRLLREFEPPADGGTARDGERREGTLDVPDPYHGGPSGFERVLDLVESCCAGLLEELQRAGRVAARP